MNYDEMQREIKRAKHQAAKDGEAAPEIKPPRPIPLSARSAAFRLFRVLRPAPNRPEYAGHADCPHCKRRVGIEAQVVKSEEGRQFFEGQVFPIAVAAARSATVTGDRAAVTRETLDLVDQANALPFDDPLPPFHNQTPGASNADT